MESIKYYFEEEDGARRVPSMGMVGCSRSSKTRTLEELALALPRFLAVEGKDPVLVVFVTFSDFSLPTEFDSANPLQALLRRFVFALSSIEHGRDIAYYTKAFNEFCEKVGPIDHFKITKWLGKSRVVLLIDELDNLDLSNLDIRSEAAEALGDFLRIYFIASPDRYVLFTSHLLGTVTKFFEIIGRALPSSRGIVRESLPIADDMLEIQEYLNPHGLEVLQAIYYGLLPGLIFDQRNGPHTNTATKAAVQKFDDQPMDYKEHWFMKILQSIFTGEIRQVPPDLHSLLTTRPPHMDENRRKRESSRISWVPFILQEVLVKTKLDENSWRERAKNDLAGLYGSMGNAALGSGKGYEILFAIAYFARSMARLPFFDVLPKHWFEDTNVEVQWDDEALAECENWQQLEDSVGLKGLQTIIAMFFPRKDLLKLYGMIVLFIKDKKIVDQRAFQLRQGNGNRRGPPLPKFEGASFFV
jgi:hypothetical protein